MFSVKTEKTFSNMWVPSSVQMAQRLLYTVVVIGLIVSSNDQGCDARNLRRKHSHGGSQGYMAQDQTQMPIFQETPNNLTVGPGDRAVLRCRVENLGTKTVSWHKESIDAPLTIALFTFIGDNRISVDFNQRSNEWSLIIQDIKPEDEGAYSCLISSKEMPADKLSYKIQLNVKTVQVSGEPYVEKGHPVHLVCNATGKPYPPKDVTWYHDGDVIDSDAQRGILITKKIETRELISVLVIQESKMRHAGNYVCRSTNGDNGSIQVHILNVAAANVKRDSSAQEIKNRNGQSGLHSSWHLHLSALLALLVTLFVNTKWRHAV